MFAYMASELITKILLCLCWVQTFDELSSDKLDLSVISCNFVDSPKLQSAMSSFDTNLVVFIVFGNLCQEI